jgi:hypothetical protein
MQAWIDSRHNRTKIAQLGKPENLITNHSTPMPEINLIFWLSHWNQTILVACSKIMWNYQFLLNILLALPQCPGMRNPVFFLSFSSQSS